MNLEMSIIERWGQIVSSHTSHMWGFCGSDKMNSIYQTYIESNKRIHSDTFNFFTIISDLYYRENFHSDIMRFFLDPLEKHGCGVLFLKIFISMLNFKKSSINVKDYLDAEVVREEGRIDILIKSGTSGRAIIIENKINNASDMQRQLPRYYDYVCPNYIIDAIVYIPLEKSKHPDKTSWTDLDKRHVDPLLIEIPAFDMSGTTNIVDNWLNPDVIHPSNPDVLSFLRQYSNLIKTLNKNIMDTIIMKEFYDELMKNNNYDYALSIRNMLKDLPAYLALRIQEKYSSCCNPFDKVWIYKGEDAVFEGAIANGIYLKMDVWCTDQGYDILFWTPDDQIKETEFNSLIAKFAVLGSFLKASDCKYRVTKHIKISEESVLYSIIDNLLVGLRDIV